MNVTRQKRKPIRLPPEVYGVPGRIFSITIGTMPRAPVFADVAFGRACIALLRDVHDNRGLLVYAYCLMPDHVHLLVATVTCKSIVTAIRAWKSMCYAERRKRGMDAKFWQRSFYDRVIRENEEIFGVATYILMNPVRAGLVRDYHDYPLCGSFEFTNL